MSVLVGGDLLYVYFMCRSEYECIHAARQDDHKSRVRTLRACEAATV